MGACGPMVQYLWISGATDAKGDIFSARGFSRPKPGLS